MPVQISNPLISETTWAALVSSEKLRSGIWLWSNLRAVGNLPATKMTIFIPLIGYLVIFNENILPYIQLSKPIFGTHIPIDDNVHISLRLLLIYFGLCFLAVGSVIYQMFCPPEIKRFGTAVEYVVASRSHMGDIALGRIEARLAAQASTMKEFVAIRDLAVDRSRNAPHEIRAEIYEKYWPDVLEMNFDNLNKSRLPAPIITLLMYTIGFIALAVPSIEVFYRVTVLAMRATLTVV